MAITTKAQLKKYIWHDYYRNYGVVSHKLILREICKVSTVNLLIQFRVCNYYCNKKNNNIVSKVMHALAYWRFCALQQKCGIELNQHTEIGPGLRLPHKYGIIIHPRSIVGSNCEIMNDVTLGNNIMKNRNAVPHLGDNVLLCTGVKVIGGVHVGNNVVVGANSVVNKDIEHDVIVAGVPAKVVKSSDTSQYLINQYMG